MTRYGAPENVQFCKLCVMSNQRPSSVVERTSTGAARETLGFNPDGVCAACEYQYEMDHVINWERRDAELRDLCAQYRSTAGNIDCVVPGSGGKDSCFTAHVLATRYGMHPMTVTWAPMMWTDVGRKNYERFRARWPHLLCERDEGTHRELTRRAFLNLCHAFQPFVVGQRHCGAKAARKLGVPLVFYGENPAQYAGPVTDNYEPRMAREHYSAKDPSVEALVLAGQSARELERVGIDPKALEGYTPISSAEAEHVDFRYLGYYLKWDSQEVYYYAADNLGFECNDQRTEGTYSKYSSIDDKLDPLHYYGTLQKFGVGRCSYDASQEIRHGKITREEGVALVKRYDQEFPARYFDDCLAYMDVNRAQALDTFMAARAEHLWDGDRIKHAVWGERA